MSTRRNTPLIDAAMFGVELTMAITCFLGSMLAIALFVTAIVWIFEVIL